MGKSSKGSLHGRRSFMRRAFVTATAGSSVLGLTTRTAGRAQDNLPGRDSATGALPGAFPEGVNLLPNPSFDLGGDVPEGWRVVSNAGTVVERDTRVVHTAEDHPSRASARIEIRREATAQSAALRAALGPVHTGEEYFGSVWIRTEGLKTQLGAHMATEFYAGQKMLGRTQTRYAPDGTIDWREFTLNGKVPEGATRLEVVLTSHAEGRVWFDDARFFRAAPEVRPLGKQFYARGNHQAKECYGAVADSRPGSAALAWLQVEGNRESLVYQPAPDQPAVQVAQDTYILSPHFAGGYLFWVEQKGTAWQIRAADLRGPGTRIIEPFRHWGRPMSLASWSEDENSWLAWEERRGRRTRIFLGLLRHGSFGEPAPVTDGAYNAYDPACTLSPDGFLYVVYSAFRWGNYRILVQKLKPDATAVGEPWRLSNDLGPCLYPSVWPRREGGIWFSYTHTSPEPRITEDTFLQDLRHQAQNKFFFNAHEVSVGVFAGERLWAPLAAPPERGVALAGCVATMSVPCASHSEHSRVFVGADGQIGLVFRKYTETPEPIGFEHTDPPLARSSKKGINTWRNLHPALCATVLREFNWSPPVSLVPRAHLEGPISLGLEGQALRIAFTEDARHTGWNSKGEWHDREGQLGVGLATLQLQNRAGRPMYELLPYVLKPTPSPSIIEPRVERKAGEFIHAVGQTHRHSALSVCLRETDREPHLPYRFSLDVMGDDFLALTDHSFNMWVTEQLIMRKLAEYYYFPGEFVAIPAYEWTGTDWDDCSHDNGPFGHMNPLWLEEHGDLKVCDPTDSDSAGCSPRKLVHLYQGQKIVAPPHHPADNLQGFNMDFFDATLMPVVEIFQNVRGSGEQLLAPGVMAYLHRPNGRWLLDALKSGKRFGFIASGDHTGLARAGVLVKELTRNGLFEGFVARRTFATTCLAMRLEFTCNSAMMGQEVSAGEADFLLTVVAPERIREIQIVRNGEDVKTVAAGQSDFDHHWSVRRREQGEFWYCRVIFENGDMAWTSPIWLV